VSEIFLKSNDLSLGYSNQIVIKGMNLNLFDEKNYQIIGKNGAGKTTLMNFISSNFDGTNFDYWQHSVTKDPVKWILNKDKSMTVKLGTGSIETKFEHGSIQLHIEWKTPEVVKGSGQSRGNSGIYFQRRYEVQVLDSYQNRTYSNGQAGSIYKQSIPLVNASRPPGEWQVYDIVFNEPKYNEEGEQIKAGTFTIFHNGVLIQNNTKIQGTTSYFGMIETKRDKLTDGMQGGTNRSLMLQDHGDGEVSYRNIWIRKL